MLNVLVLMPHTYDTAPGARFRIEQWARHLEGDGFQFTFAAFEDDVLHRVIYTHGNHVKKAVALLRASLRRLALVRSVGDFDLVFLYREAALIGPAVIERLISAQGVPIVYDFDDPIWMPYRSPKNALFARLKSPRKTEAICRLAAHVIVGNRLLAGWAAQHSQRVDVVPSTVDLDRYPIKPVENGSAPVTLGWTGSHSTLPFFEAALGVLRGLARRHPLQMLVISHTDQYQPDDFPAPVVSRRWNAATEAEDLHAIDIGLAPFPDEGWTPWRCHGKVLQYMAAGIPTVASCIGVLPDYIEDGVNGFLASTDNQWSDRLSTLIQDQDLRRTMGLRGREAIRERYSAYAWLPRIRAILTEAARRRP